MNNDEAQGPAPPPEKVCGGGWMYARVGSRVAVCREGARVDGAAAGEVLWLKEEELFGFCAAAEYAGAQLLPELLEDVITDRCPVEFFFDPESKHPIHQGGISCCSMTGPTFKTFGVPPQKDAVVVLPGLGRVRVVTVEWAYEANGGRRVLVGVGLIAGGQNHKA